MVYDITVYISVKCSLNKKKTIDFWLKTSEM